MDTDKVFIHWWGGKSFRLRGAPAAARRSSEDKLRRARSDAPYLQIICPIRVYLCSSVVKVLFF